MKWNASLLKSIWLLLIALLVMIGRGLPLPLLVVLVAIMFFVPIIVEFSPKTKLDERQVYISHLSGHWGFYVFLGLTVLIMLRDYVRLGKNPAPEWYALLIIPLLVKFAISLYQNYEAQKVAYAVGYGWGGVWLLFVLFSHGLSLTTLIEFTPFALVVILVFLFRKRNAVSGVLFIFFAVGLTIFFHGWWRLDLYVRLLMYTLVPLPLLVSGIVLLKESLTQRS